ncbi:hypothetical protein DB32_005807 [Sandaracinus amylolyticus]|uniref:DUF4239 domain-containing protein n=2 Tax=Sandaracinus amylolyticus TaxID=927083 RepID=A0A0F6W6Q1_9BACT|nr:hypothetical protein DB32_005807 [Sandaracinus amylolyticus]
MPHPMSDRIVDGAPSWWVSLLLGIVVLLAATELGFRIGERRSRSAQQGAIAGQSAATLAALLGMLGLLLAFSFGIVEGRFAMRKQLVLDEANAIGTAYLRAAMLPDPHREHVQELLREYVDTRTPRALEDVDAAMRRSGALHRRLWAEAVTAARLDPRSEPTALFVTALNDVIDLHEERVTVALRQRLPAPVFLTLIGVALLGMSVLGYGAGVTNARATLPIVAFAVAVATVMVVIVELDRPGGIFRVSQSAMLDTRDAMRRDAEVARERVTSGGGAPTTK